MPRYTALISILTIAFLSVALACGDDDNDNGNASPGGNGNASPGGNGGPGGGSAGNVSFEFSGEADGQKDGIAYVGTFESEHSSNYQFNFTDTDTFFMTLSRMGEGTDAPDEGTYSIGGMVADFWVSFELYEDGDASNSVDYAATSGETGTLEITSSGSSSMVGTFEFTAPNISDMEGGGEITVSNGEFTAVVN